MIKHMKLGLAAAGLAFALAAPGAQAARWIKVESEHFVVYSDNGEARTRAYLGKLEQYRYVLTRFYAAADGTAEPRLKVYFVASRNELRETAPQLGELVAGYMNSCAEDKAMLATSEFERVQKTDVLKDQDEDWNQVILFHEYAHDFMFAHTDQRYPPWYVEGFAEYYSTARLQADKVLLGSALAQRVGTFVDVGYKVTYEDLLRDTWRPRIGKGDNETLRFYAQSWLLTHWIMADPDRQAKFNSIFLKAYGAGKDPVAAFEDAFGIKVADLDKTLRAHLGKIVQTTYRIADMPDPKVTVTEMPASANTLLLLDLGARCPAKKEAPEFLRKIRAEAANFPADDYARRVSARAEIVIGDEQKALPWLKARIAANPGDADAQFLLGEAWYLMTVHKTLLDGETAASQLSHARSALAASFNLDPLNAADLYYYAEAQHDLPDFPGPQAIDAAMEAHYLQPSERDYALLAADLLIRKDRAPEAREMLFPLASNPHNPKAVKWISGVIDAIDQGKPKAEILKTLHDFRAGGDDDGDDPSHPKTPDKPTSPDGK